MTLVEWAHHVCAELELSEEIDKEDVDRILEVARDAAHSIARPAAPLTTYLLGIAVGRGADPARAAAIAQSAALARAESDEEDGTSGTA